MKPTQPRIIIVLSGCFGAVIGAETLLVELGNQGYRLNVVLRCDSPEVIKTAVSKKLGVGFLYEDSVKEGLASGVFKKLRISGLQMEGNTYLIYHKNRPLSSNGDIFLNQLRQWRDEKGTKKG